MGRHSYGWKHDHLMDYRRLLGTFVRNQANIAGIVEHRADILDPMHVEALGVYVTALNEGEDG
jgi:hypothetical protein